ncbi:MAG: Type secretion system protein [Planctomycetota bacterium]|jgi:general secretion pathway protein E/type IV pilus assembly protein PilB
MNPVLTTTHEEANAGSMTIDSLQPANALSAIPSSNSASDESRRFAAMIGVPLVDLRSISLDPAAVSMLPAREISRRQMLPYGFHDSKLLVAISETCDLDGLDEIRMRTNRPLELRVARREELHELIKSVVGLGGGTLNELSAATPEYVRDTEDNEDDLANEASIVRLVNELIRDAILRRASDVHLEPTAAGMLVRYRIDGMLEPESASDELHRFRKAIVSRIKIMAKLNIAERRLPQDGRIRLRLEDGERDVRVSIIPMLHGEGIVLRLLDPHRSLVDLGDLAIPSNEAQAFDQLIHAPHGIILVTGPTGSGKTTTLYAALAELRGPKKKIVTIEDPVEYEMEGVNQIQVQPKVGLTFASGLRSVLRHDPDVILVGEIRDPETARSAIQAAMTGHLVFSTLHTNDAPSAYARMIDMGIEPYLAADAIIGVMAQRLVRRLCPHCRTPYAPQPGSLPPDFGDPLPSVLWNPVGCRECRGSGYLGRVAIFELVPSSSSIRDACVHQANLAELHRTATRIGYRPLRFDGWQKVRQGVTSIDEVLRVAGHGLEGSVGDASEVTSLEAKASDVNRSHGEASSDFSTG